MVKHAQNYADAKTLDAKATEWLGAIEQAAPRRHALKLDPRHCALLVIDAQRYFAAPDGRAYQPTAAAIVPRLARLLTRWRQAGFRVAFTAHGHQGPDDLGMMGRFFRDHLRVGEPDAAILAELAPLPGEPVFAKNTYDAFYRTPLSAWLDEHHLTQALIAGMLTELCCDTTARSAFVRGYEVYVGADLTLTSTEQLHLGSLIGLARGVATVMAAAEIEALCG